MYVVAAEMTSTHLLLVLLVVVVAVRATPALSTAGNSINAVDWQRPTDSLHTGLLFSYRISYHIISGICSAPITKRT